MTLKQKAGKKANDPKKPQRRYIPLEGSKGVDRQSRRRVGSKKLPFHLITIPLTKIRFEVIQTHPINQVQSCFADITLFIQCNPGRQSAKSLDEGRAASTLRRAIQGHAAL